MLPAHFRTGGVGGGKLTNYNNRMPRSDDHNMIVKQQSETPTEDINYGISCGGEDKDFFPLFLLPISFYALLFLSFNFYFS